MLIFVAPPRPGEWILSAHSQAEHSCNRARHQARIGERRQIDQPDDVFIIGDHALRDGEGDRGLADTALRQLFSWAKRKDLIETNPAADVDKPLKRVPSPDRVLNDDEIRGFWSGCDEFGWPGGRILQLLLRLLSVRARWHMQWSGLDIDNRVWNIPASRAKNNKAHTVHLNDLAVEIIKGLPQINGSEFVFTINGTKPLVNFSFAKRRAERAMGTSDWRFHDLGRTTTLMARLGIPPHVADKVLNHQSGTISGVAAVYNRFEYLDERKAALEALGRFIEKLIGRGGDNVVKLRPSA